MNKQATVTEERFNGMVDKLLEMARYMFEVRGQLMPVALLMHNMEKPQVSIIPADWMASPQTKGEGIALLKDVASKMDAFAIALVNEAWLVAVSTEPHGLEAARAETRKYGGIKDHPDRVEVVMVNTEFRPEVGAVQSRMYVAKIQRPEVGPPQVLGFELQKGDQYSGLLTGILDGLHVSDSRDLE